MIGDDTDLAWRGIEAGFRAGFAPAAIVHHDVFPQSWGQHLRNKQRLEGLVLMYKKHPQLQQEFGKRWIYLTEHLSALAIGAGVVGLGVRRLRPLVLAGLLGAAWHVNLYTRYKPRPIEPGGWATALPLAAVADAYGALVMLRASVRYRKLLV
jgi:hypothetical protein